MPKMFWFSHPNWHVFLCESVKQSLFNILYKSSYDIWSVYVYKFSFGGMGLNSE